jgi:hypothetical protein
MLPATTKNPLRSSREVPGFNQNWNFWTDFSQKISSRYQTSRKCLQWQPRCFIVDKRTGKTKVTGASRDNANTPKK